MPKDSSQSNLYDARKKDAHNTHERRSVKNHDQSSFSDIHRFKMEQRWNVCVLINSCLENFLHYRSRAPVALRTATTDHATAVVS